MDEFYAIPITKTSKYWECIDEKFDECPEGEFDYPPTKIFYKKEYKQSGNCTDLVTVINNDTGKSSRILPIKLKEA